MKLPRILFEYTILVVRHSKATKRVFNSLYEEIKRYWGIYNISINLEVIFSGEFLKFVSRFRITEGKYYQ